VTKTGFFNITVRIFPPCKTTVRRCSPLGSSATSRFAFGDGSVFPAPFENACPPYRTNRRLTLLGHEAREVN